MDSKQADFIKSKYHHIRHELCVTRPKYREGRKLKAVKVYTVNDESQYLLIQGVPSVGAHNDLISLFGAYGKVQEYKLLDEYPAQEYTEVFWLKYDKIQSARIAKRKLDDYNFYGGTIHVCYAPEFESVDETRAKLLDRRRAVASRIRKFQQEEQDDYVSKAEKVPSDQDSVHSTNATNGQKIGQDLEKSAGHMHQSEHHDSQALAPPCPPSMPLEAPPWASQEPRFQPPPPHVLPRFPPTPYGPPPPHGRSPSGPPPHGWSPSGPPPHGWPPSGPPPHGWPPSGPPPHGWPPSGPPPHGWPPSGPPPHGWPPSGPPPHGWPPSGPPPHGWPPSGPPPHGWPPSGPPPWGGPHHQSLPPQHFKPFYPSMEKDTDIYDEVNNSQENKTNGKAKDNVVASSGEDANVASDSKIKEGQVIKNYKAKSNTTPKFVPRQVVHKHDVSVLQKKGLMGKSKMKETGQEKSNIKDSKSVDMVNEELRRRALELGEETGPRLPQEEEEKRQVFLTSQTGSKSMDMTVAEIRKRVKEFSEIAQPPQIKKKKKR